MKESLKIIPSAVLAGICIGIGGYVYTTVTGLWGAVLFAFGLLTVVHYGLHLYTGKAGFFTSRKGVAQLFTVILFGNVIGCWLVALIASAPVVAACQNIVAGRLDAGCLTNFLLAIPCGFIMTTAVEFGRQGKFLPLLFGVPVFIMCGFRHSIADAFYYTAAATWSAALLGNWVLIVMGNFVGCNLYRLLIHKD